MHVDGVFCCTERSLFASASFSWWASRVQITRTLSRRAIVSRERLSCLSFQFHFPAKRALWGKGKGGVQELFQEELWRGGQPLVTGAGSGGGAHLGTWNSREVERGKGKAEGPVKVAQVVAAGPDPSMRVGVPAKAGGVREGNRALRVSGWTTPLQS